MNLIKPPQIHYLFHQSLVKIVRILEITCKEIVHIEYQSWGKNKNKFDQLGVGKDALLKIHAIPKNYRKSVQFILRGAFKTWHLCIMHYIQNLYIKLRKRIRLHFYFL